MSEWHGAESIETTLVWRTPSATPFFAAAHDLKFVSDLLLAIDVGQGQADKHDAAGKVDPSVPNNRPGVSHLTPRVVTCAPELAPGLVRALAS